MSYSPPFYKKLFHSSRRALAKIWLSRMPAMQIAVTGSQGKTNTAQAIYAVLSGLGPTVVSEINLDTIYNVPITAIKVRPQTKFAIFELGIDQMGEMDRHLEIVKPKIGIITGISPVHTDKEHLESLENLIKEKRKLIEALPKDGYAILNYDDINVRAMAPYTKAKVLWYGTDEKHCDVYVDPETIKVTLHGTQFQLVSTSFNEFQRVSTKLIGRHHIYTIMPAFIVYQIIAKSQLPKARPFEAGISRLSPLPGRMSLEPGPLETTVLNDSLRANPSSTAAGLNTLSEINYKNGKKIAILAEMGELENPIEEHKKIGQLIGKLDIDYLVAIGPWQKYVANEAIKCGKNKNQVFWVKDVFEAAIVLQPIIKKSDLIYLKGSLLRHVERVLMLLNNEKVGCTVTLCPFYNHCPECKYLIKGYQGV